MEKTVQKIPFLRLSIALAAGIIIGSLLNLSGFVIFPVVIFFLSILILINKFYKYSLTSVFGLFIHLFFICTGIIIYETYNAKPDFFENGKFLATVLETPQEKANSYKSLLKIEAFYRNDSTFKTNEKILVYFAKEIKAKELQPGNKIIFLQTPEFVENNGNPFEFDYKKYLSNKKIHRQVYLSSVKWSKTTMDNSVSPIILAEKTRDKLISIYRTQNLDNDEFEILSALTLGYKRELDPEIKHVFSAAGAMHVLAVSGLHVGIIYWILSLFLGFFKRLKYGRFGFVFITILSLWIFAFITGLSPSVMRAATMFTFVSIGTGFKRQSSIYNTLASSAFFLLLINPNNLFEVGFQLSYSAVFGIVFLQPKFQKILTIRNKILNYFWILLTVSVAAQIATFPISLYYFNQFPTYFWISNLFVIPAVFVLIPLGISLLVFSGISIIAVPISYILNYTISSLYFLLRKIQELPFSIQQVSIHIYELLLIIILLVSFLLFMKSPRILYLKSTLILLVLIFTTSFVYKINANHRKEIIVYNNSDNLTIHLITGKKNYIISEHKIEENDYNFSIIKNSCIKLNLKTPHFILKRNAFNNDHLFTQNGIIFFENKLILMDVKTSKIPANYNPDYYINPSYNENITESTHNNSTLISNRKYYPNKAEPLIPIYQVNKSGAFRKKW